jgi:hypothetical protein
MKRIIADKIASATKNVPLDKDLRITEELQAEEGYIVAGIIHGNKTVYNQLEDPHGRMVTLHDGDLVVGVLGHRNAMHCYAGHVPEQIAPGDKLQVLNLGGVIGKCTSANPEVGEPFDIEILGNVLTFPEFQNRKGVAAHVGMNTIPLEKRLSPKVNVPIVFVVGTSMNSGKTSASCAIIRELRRRGLKVGGCKLTGVSSLRDSLEMRDHGAHWACSYVDAGVVATSPATAVPTACAIINHLASQGAEVIIAEFGDGILGTYGVSEILSDGILGRHFAAVVLCACDPVGAWGGVQILKEKFNLPVDVVSGPTTDNTAGSGFITEKMKMAAINAMRQGEELGSLILERLDGWKARQEIS